VSRRGPAFTKPRVAPATGGFALVPKRADDLVETCGINVCWGMPSETGSFDRPDSTRPQRNNGPDVLYPKLADIGFRYARQCLGFNFPYNPSYSRFGWPIQYDLGIDAAVRAMNKLNDLGIKPGYTMWCRADYDFLKTGRFPKPAWIEAVNEPPLPTYNGIFDPTLNPAFTWTNGASYTPGQLATNGGYAFICLTAHTASAGNAPPSATTQASLDFNNGFWQSTWSYQVATTTAWANDLIESVPGWNQNVDLVGSSTPTHTQGWTAAQRAVLTKRAIYQNVHDYRLPAYAHETSWDSARDWKRNSADTLAALDVHNGWQAAYGPGYVTEMTAWRCGPADGKSAMSETDAAKLWVRTFLYAHGAIGFRRVLGWMASEQYGLDEEAQTCGPTVGQGYAGRGYFGRAGLIRMPEDGGDYKVPAQWIKALFSIYGERGAATSYSLDPLTVSWATRDATLAETLHKRSNGQYLYAYWLKAEVVANGSTGVLTFQFDTPTGLNPGVVGNATAYALGTVGQFQNNQSATKLTTGSASAVTFDRSFTNVETYDFSTGVWTSLGARTAGSSITLTPTESPKLVRLTP